MSRERKLIFLGVVLVILIIPMVLPSLLGHIVLPWWTYVFYAGIVLVNAGIYWIQRGFLIDRFFVRGQVGVYVLLSACLFFLGLGLQYFMHAVFGNFTIDKGVTVSEYLGELFTISQLTLMSVIQLVTSAAALAVGMSDQWRRAAFRYHQAERDNQALSADLDQLKGEMDALKRPAAQPESISVKIDLVMTQIPLEDILYIKSDGDYIVLHLSDGRAPMVLMTLKAMEKQLPFDRFCRIHRSYLVNLSKVQGMRGGKIRVGAEELPLSDSCKAAFFELLSHKSIILKTE